MQPKLAWLNFNAAESERTQRMLAQLNGQDTRDELGLGAIRDSIADLLFPGTSTIQTRLRYYLFVPWIYQELEKAERSGPRIATLGRERELDLMECLLAHGEDDGVFGLVAKRELKRLPSSVYWAGLQRWKICLFPDSLTDYHRRLDAILRSRRPRGEEPENASKTWYAKLPEVPDKFPQQATLDLSRDEAAFLSDRVQVACKGTLLAHLFLKPTEIDDTVMYPWLHPGYGSFSSTNKTLVEEARLFSEVFYGAALLYNLLLSRLVEKREWIQDYEARLAQWRQLLHRRRGEIETWSLPDFWSNVKHPEHTVRASTQTFVTEWVRTALGSDGDVINNLAAHRLIRNRERDIKGYRSRFDNEQSRRKWTGAAGAYRLTYRWRTVVRFVNDLAEGLA